MKDNNFDAFENPEPSEEIIGQRVAFSEKLNEAVKSGDRAQLEGAVEETLMFISSAAENAKSHQAFNALRELFGEAESAAHRLKEMDREGGNEEAGLTIDKQEDFRRMSERLDDLQANIAA